MTITIGYWNIRGLVAYVYYALEYAGAEYNQEKYVLKGSWEEGFDRSHWLDVKHTLGLKFPNIPYLIDGDIRITESNAILRHVGRKYNLYGSTLEQQAEVDMLVDAIGDVRSAMIPMFYVNTCAKTAGYDERKARFYADLDGYKQRIVNGLKGFEAQLEDKTFLVGTETPTIADFILFENADVLALFFGREFLTPNILAHRDRMAALPAIEKFLKSDKADVQCNNGSAIWRGPMDDHVKQF